MMLGLLGLDPLDTVWTAGPSQEPALRTALDSLVQALVAQRDDARRHRNFEAADAIRDQLRTAGVDVEDTPHGTRWTVHA
jgi:cysteinyl-tRNA synthetase